MAEFKVRIWRRTEPRVGDKTRIVGLEHDEVSVEAPNRDSALNQVMDAERSCGKRIRLYVRIDTPNGGHYGIGDYTLIELANKEDRERLAAKSGQDEK